MANALTMELLNSSSMVSIFKFELYKVRQQDKNDVKQTCILEILKALSKAKAVIPEEKMPSFCQTIIHRTVVDYYRKNYRMIETNSTLVHYSDYCYDDSESDQSNGGFSAESKEYGYELSMIQSDYLANKELFSPSEQEFLDYYLFNEEGMAMRLKEITEELAICKTHASKAMRKLRKLVS